MPFLYVVEHGSTLRVSGEQIVVEKEGETLLEVELPTLVSVVILASVQVTSQALAAMLKGGVELAIVTTNGRLLGQLTPPLARNQAIRLAQFQKESDAEFVLRQCRAIVGTKCANQRNVLLRHTSLQSGAQPEVAAAAEAIERHLRPLGEATSVGQLMGIEGACAAAYWGVFGRLLRAEGGSFTGRQARPPRDPVNAALSLGYTLLGNMMTSILDAYGFDPFVGFMHEETYGHPALALDLIEPFRAPVVDRMVVRLFNLGMLKPDDFAPEGDEDGLRMDDDALRVFFREWERALAQHELREAIKAQAEQLARVFRGEQETLEPWSWHYREGSGG